jgi:hypothetical protein
MLRYIAAIIDKAAAQRNIKGTVASMVFSFANDFKILNKKNPRQAEG